MIADIVCFCFEDGLESDDDRDGRSGDESGEDSEKENDGVVGSESEESNGESEGENTEGESRATFLQICLAPLCCTQWDFLFFLFWEPK